MRNPLPKLGLVALFGMCCVYTANADIDRETATQVLTKLFSSREHHAFEWEVERKFLKNERKLANIDKMIDRELSSVAKDNKAAIANLESKRQRFKEFALPHTKNIRIDLKYVNPQTFNCREAFQGGRTFDYYFDNNDGCFVNEQYREIRTVGDGSYLLSSLMIGDLLLRLNKTLFEPWSFSEFTKKDQQYTAKIQLPNKDSSIEISLSEDLKINQLRWYKGNHVAYAIHAEYGNTGAPVPIKSEVTIYDTASDQVIRTETWKLLSTSDVDPTKVQTKYTVKSDYTIIAPSGVSGSPLDFGGAD